MLAVAVIFCLALVCSARPKWNQLNDYSFAQYAKDFSKEYAAGTDVWNVRKTIFEKNLNSIRQFNSKPATYRQGVNHMTDWTNSEFQALNGARPREMGQFSKSSIRSEFVSTEVQVPKSVDYRLRLPSILTAVKDQGMCGSCWAHGATEQMETFWALSTGELNVLSQQQVTACTQNPNQCGGTGGCGGATAELAFEYVVGAGLTSEWKYPYTAWSGTTGTCLPNQGSIITVTGYTAVPINDQLAVMEALASKGPLAVNVDASSWSTYESGIFSGCDFSKNITIDHVVQLVGYGTDLTSGLDYWIVRNSWTPSYGEDGYIRLLKTSTPSCGWDVNPQDGTGCNGGPPQLWTCGMCGILFDTTYPNMG